MNPNKEMIYFSIIVMPKKSHFTTSVINLCAKHEKTCEFHSYCWDHVCQVNEWCLVECFHHKFRVSTQIMVHNYCITKYKMFSTCDRPLNPFKPCSDFHYVWGRTLNSHLVSSFFFFFFLLSLLKINAKK